MLKFFMVAATLHAQPLNLWLISGFQKVLDNEELEQISPEIAPHLT